MGERGSGDVREGSGGVKGVLSLWREKVFVLLVQSRLQQMQHTAECNEVQHKVSRMHMCMYCIYNVHVHACTLTCSIYALTMYMYICTCIHVHVHVHVYIQCT